MDFQKITKRKYYLIPNASPNLLQKEDLKEKKFNMYDIKKSKEETTE